MPIPMYPGQVNSPATTLLGAISAQDTTIPVADASKLPSPPNIAVIGIGENAETILYTGVSGNTLTGVTRGFQGTPRAWAAGTQIARLFTAYDYDALRQNVDDLWGLISQGLVEGNSAVVLSSQLPATIKDNAVRARTVFKERLQVCDGVDDHVEIQNALNAIPEGGEVILVGGLFVGGGITLASGKSVRGMGFGTVYKLKDGANTDVFSGAGSGTDPYPNFARFTISNLTIDGNRVSQTSGNGIHLKQGLDIALQNLRVVNCKQAGILIEDMIRTAVRGVWVEDSQDGLVVKDCIYGQNVFSSLVLYRVDRYALYALAQNKENVDMIFSDIMIREAQEGIRIEGNNFISGGNLFSNIKIHFVLNGTGRGIYINPHGYDNIIAGVSMNDTIEGVVIDTHDTHLTSVAMGFIRRNGIVVNGDNNVIQGVLINGAGIETDNTYSAIRLNGSYNRVRLCNIRTSQANRAKYSVEEVAGDNNVITDNTFLDAGTKPVVKVGANTVVKRNQGYRTENCGVATFSGNGTQTQFTIPHGLAEAPTAVALEAKSADAAGAKYWTADATNITVTFITAPPAGTNNVVLSWKAEV